jgi:hypothetical protein
MLMELLPKRSSLFRLAMDEGAVRSFSWRSGLLTDTSLILLITGEINSVSIPGVLVMEVSKKVISTASVAVFLRLPEIASVCAGKTFRQRIRQRITTNGLPKVII